MTGAAWLILRGFHQLFFRPVRARRVWREAIFIAVFVFSLAWLQLNQAFSLLLAVVIARRADLAGSVLEYPRA